MNLLCSLFGFYMKWRTTKLNEILKTNLDAFLIAFMQVYVVRPWTSTCRYNSLLFVMKFRIQLATVRNISQTIAKIRHAIVLDRLICKLAGHNLITGDIKR